MSDPTFASLQGKSWRLNTPDVSSELIGGEVVAIHLPTGMYYSLENAASVVWAAIERGSNFEQLVQALSATYEVDVAQAQIDTVNFLKELVDEKLIVEAPESTEGGPTEAVPGEKKPYFAPKLEKFPDLQDLLMIDPIHEVDQRGWPHTKPE